MVFEIYGVMLAMHQDARLLRSSDGPRRARAGLARLLDAARASRTAKSVAATGPRRRSASRGVRK
jgi:hypothetical protein